MVKNKLTDIRTWVLFAALSLAFQLIFPPESYQHLIKAIKQVATPSKASTGHKTDYSNTGAQVVSHVANPQAQ